MEPRLQLSPITPSSESKLASPISPQGLVMRMCDCSSADSISVSTSPGSPFAAMPAVTASSTERASSWSSWVMSPTASRNTESISTEMLVVQCEPLFDLALMKSMIDSSRHDMIDILALRRAPPATTAQAISWSMRMVSRPESFAPTAPVRMSLTATSERTNAVGPDALPPNVLSGVP